MIYAALARLDTLLACKEWIAAIHALGLLAVGQDLEDVAFAVVAGA